MWFLRDFILSIFLICFPLFFLKALLKIDEKIENKKKI